MSLFVTDTLDFALALVAYVELKKATSVFHRDCRDLQVNFGFHLQLDLLAALCCLIVLSQSI